MQCLHTIIDYFQFIITKHANPNIPLLIFIENKRQALWDYATGNSTIIYFWLVILMRKIIFKIRLGKKIKLLHIKEFLEKAVSSIFGIC